ncbi:MAG: hypothetical protein Q8Q49_01280 [bacterium]|nr:hypothetical protein [bacterium]
MKAERVILSFIALLIGLGVAGGVFYLYQSSKTVQTPGKKPLPTVVLPSPTPDETKGILVVEKPKDEDVTTDNTVTVSGKTESDAIVIISSASDEQVASPTATGSFTVTLSLDDGENLIHILAKFSDGTEKKEDRTVTVSSENF